jgi:hypothetical protein
MIICKKCGHRNADADQWCANTDCGAYLAFDRAVQHTPLPQPPVVDPNADTLEMLRITPPAPAPAPQSSRYQPQPPTASQPPVSQPARPAGPEIPLVRPGETMCVHGGHHVGLCGSSWPS